MWNLQSNHYGNTTGKKFETDAQTPNCYYFSGYSASVISFLTSKVSNAEELFDQAMNQQILNEIVL